MSVAGRWECHLASCWKIPVSSASEKAVLHYAGKYQHHHHPRVACPMDVAIIMSIQCLSILCSMIGSCQTNAERSDIRFICPLSQVWWGHSDLRFPSLSKGHTEPSTRLWSVDGSSRAVWSNNLRRVVQMMYVSGGWSVHLRSSFFEMWSLQEICSMRCRHHWSNASMSLDSCRVGDCVLDP